MSYLEWPYEYMQSLLYLIIIAIYNFRVAASYYLIKAGETHGTVEIKIAVGKFLQISLTTFP